jgi:phosphoribosylformylglycinamidine synthase
MGRTGIVRYPGSNCDFDTLRYFPGSFFIWHTQGKDDFPDDMDLLVIPGGFAFGDRVYDKATARYVIAPGVMALNSPVTDIIQEAHRREIPILGICNGFQILVHMGLLPGKLVLNDGGKFVSKKVRLSGCGGSREWAGDMYIANSYGKYQFSDTETGDFQVFLRYQDDLPEIGSINGIAGICNKKKTVYGMMPHPERSIGVGKEFTDIQDLFEHKNRGSQFKVFKEKITELMHSEHISYKSTRKYLKRMHTEAPWVIEGPGENAGIVDIGNGYCIAFRIESHNHPTYIDPFEGAATGVGGIMRDIFTMGARPIAILDFLRFGTDAHSEQLLQGAIDGISYYGNCVGVANVGGDLRVHDSYDKNPLVNVGCLGLVRKEHIIRGRATESGQVLIYVGSKTGNEGIGGAAMASRSFQDTDDAEALKSNVQKSDPFLEKLLLEACCEIAEQGLAAGMQDMGAGGLLCASHELVSRAGKELGCKIDLSKVPVKYEMEPCNILISESQERMLIVVDPSKIEEIYSVFEKWDLEHAVIGEVTEDGDYSMYSGMELLYRESVGSNVDIIEDWPMINAIPAPPALKIKDASLWTVYDSTIGNRTIKGPDQDGSYAILNIPEAETQLCLTWGETFDECLETMTAKGGFRPLCIVNCLNYGHPEDSIGNISEFTENLSKQCKLHNVPIIGGNVSLYNSTDSKSIRPSPVILMMGAGPGK